MIRILEKLKRVGPTKLLRWFLGIGVCFLALYTVICYIVGPSRGYFHSDCTDSLFWAQATYDSGKVISTDYNYAALLPFGASVWYLPLIAMFGVTMFTQIAGMVIFALLFTASVIFLCRSLHWSYPASFAAAAAELLLMSGSDKLREIMWGHTIYYSLGLLLLFVGLGMAVRVAERMSEILSCRRERRALPLSEASPLDDSAKRLQRKKYICFFILTAVFAVFVLLCATNGMQVLLLSTIPFAGALFCERFFDGEEKLISAKNIPVYITVLLSAVATIGGLFLLSALRGDVTAGYASMYSVYSDPSVWLNNLLALPGQYFSLIGVTVARGDPLIDLKSIESLVKIVTGILILVLPLVGFCFYKKLRYTQTRTLLWAHLFVTLFVMLGWIFGSLSDAAWRLTPVLGTAVLATVALSRDFFAQKGSALRFSVLTLAALMCFGMLNMTQMRAIPADYGADNDLHLLAEKLESENLTYGYATFWNAQAITVLSDSEVKVRNISVTASGFAKNTYQSAYSWYDDQPGQEEYFVLMSQSEYLRARDFLRGLTHPTSELVSHIVRDIEFEGYHIVVFDCNIWL